MIFTKLIHNLQTKTKIFLGFFIILSFVLALGVVSYASIKSVVETDKWVAHTHKALDGGQGVLVLALDMETGMRGYLLAGKEEFLQPYYLGEVAAFNEIAVLKKTVSDNPAQILRVEKMEEILREWKTEVTEPTISLRSEIGTSKTMDDMAALVGQAKGKTYFDEFRSVLGEFEAEERYLMALRQASNSSQVSSTFFFIQIFIPLAFIVGVIVALIIGDGIAAPLKRMTTDMLLLAEGNTAIKVTGLGRGDEIGSMANAVQVFKEGAIEADRLRSEEEIHRVELEKAKKLAEKAAESNARFLANMSHEIRTPLNGVLGTAGVLAHTDLDKTQETCVETIQSSGKALLALLNDILDISKMDAGEFKIDPYPTDLAKMLHEIKGLYKPLFDEKSLDYAFKYPEDLPKAVACDALRVRQILSNLIGNALKFTKKGHVNVELTVLERRDSRVNLKFTVEDTGMGIPEGELDSVFKTFAQLDKNDRNAEGTGLGLSICRSLVNMMRGDIGVESTEGEGATFWFTIELDVLADAALEENIVVMPALATVDASVLVAEDVKANQFVLKLMLEGVSARMDIVENGELAVEKIKDGNHYDLVLMDCNMPIMDGYEATSIIRKLGHKDLPIIAVTANALKGDENICLEAGMDDFIPKPIVVEALHQILIKWLPESKYTLLEQDDAQKEV